MKSLVPLRQFADYRTFLLAHFQEHKRQRPVWSYALWARKLGLNGASAISRVVQGQRDPGPALVKKLADYFEFDDQETSYFQDLVRLRKSEKDPKLSALLLEKLHKQHPGGHIQNVDVDTFELISNWYYLAIRELSGAAVFKDDANWIAERFLVPITPEQASDAVERLLKLGLLERTADGVLQRGKGRIDIAGNIGSMAVRHYHDEMLANASQCQHKVDVSEKDYRGTTILVSRKNLSKAKAVITEFHKKLAELIEEESGDSLYQFQTQLFPLTHTLENA